jgi:hypothetical protein
MAIDRYKKLILLLIKKLFDKVITSKQEERYAIH